MSVNKVATFFLSIYWTIILIPLGIILIVFSIFSFSGVDHIKNYIKTDAVVSKKVLYEAGYEDSEGNWTEATYTIYVNYTANGVEYHDIEYGVFSGYSVGDKLTICYNPNDPTDIAQPNGTALPIALLCGGIAVTFGGVIATVFAAKKRKKLKEQEKEWSNGN